MRSLSDFAGSTLEWTQPKSFERFYELRVGETRLATLSFRSSFGTLAVVETSEGKWTFKRVGFLNPKITVRIAGSDEDLAVYHPKFWGDGILAFRSGPNFAWRPTNFWATDWAFADAEDKLVLDLKAGVAKEKLRDIFKIQCTVELAQVQRYGDLIPVLIPLGMYLLILHHQDAAAAAAASSGAVAG
jgi:hypothetical protein